MAEVIYRGLVVNLFYMRLKSIFIIYVFHKKRSSLWTSNYAERNKDNPFFFKQQNIQQQKKKAQKWTTKQFIIKFKLKKMKIPLNPLHIKNKTNYNFLAQWVVYVGKFLKIFLNRKKKVKVLIFMPKTSIWQCFYPV